MQCVAGTWLEPIMGNSWKQKQNEKEKGANQGEPSRYIWREILVYHNKIAAEHVSKAEAAAAARLKLKGVFVFIEKKILAISAKMTSSESKSTAKFQLQKSFLCEEFKVSTTTNTKTMGMGLSIVYVSFCFLN